jgi:hypothetical protein
MRTGTPHLIRLVLFILAALAVVPAAHAGGTPPDDRAFYRGTTADLDPANVSPDDRAYARDGSVSSTTRIVSPDDRSLGRDASVSSPTRIVSPDDRAFSRAVPEPRVLQAPTSIQPHGFDWGDALIGGTFGLVLAMLGAGGVALLMRHRTVPRAA